MHRTVPASKTTLLLQATSADAVAWRRRTHLHLASKQTPVVQSAVLATLTALAHQEYGNDDDSRHDADTASLELTVEDVRPVRSPGHRG